MLEVAQPYIVTFLHLKKIFVKENTKRIALRYKMEPQYSSWIPERAVHLVGEGASEGALYVFCPLVQLDECRKTVVADPKLK